MINYDKKYDFFKKNLQILCRVEILKIEVLSEIKK